MLDCFTVMKLTSHTGWSIHVYIHQITFCTNISCLFQPTCQEIFRFVTVCRAFAVFGVLTLFPPKGADHLKLPGSHDYTCIDIYTTDLWPLHPPPPCMLPPPGVSCLISRLRGLQRGGWGWLWRWLWRGRSVGGGRGWGLGVVSLACCERFNKKIPDPKFFPRGVNIQTFCSIYADAG